MNRYLRTRTQERRVWNKKKRKRIRIREFFKLIMENVKRVGDLFRRSIGGKFTLGMNWTGTGNTVGSVMLQIKIGRLNDDTFKTIKVGVELEENGG
jgi:hypothetical protein